MSRISRVQQGNLGIVPDTYRRRFLAPCRAGDRTPDGEARLRSEIEAPFRPVRLAFYYTGVAGATLGFFINLTQLIGAIGGAPGAQSVIEVVQSLGIDLGAAVVLAFLIRSDLQAQEKQMARLSREQRLGELSVKLSDGKAINVADLRGNCRVVIVAGSDEQISACMDVAEGFREKLTKCATFIIQAPIFGETTSSGPGVKEDLRWKGTAVGKNAWVGWFKDQLAEAGVSLDRAKENGLYIGLRMDGRVRSSGVGLPPPWERFANELPPNEGIWKGFGDGFDGKV